MIHPKQLRLTFSAPAGLVLVLIVADAAYGHSVNKQFGDFYGGMLHPLTALEHLLPILGLGLLAGQQGTAVSRWVVLLFPMGLFLGASLGGPWEPSGWIEWFNRLSFVGLGILIAAEVRVPTSVAAILAVAAGLAHGYENTADVSSTVCLPLFVPGIVVSGIALVAVFAAVAASREAPWQKVAVRVAGSWITATGILVIGVIV